MNCQLCDKPATIHVTEMVAGRPEEFHVCDEHIADVAHRNCPPAARPQCSPLWEVFRDPRIREAIADADARRTLVAYLLPPLCAALLDRNPEVRLRAALFIGRLQGDAESALRALRDALLDGDERVKKVAEVAIAEIENGSMQYPQGFVL